MRCGCYRRLFSQLVVVMVALGMFSDVRSEETALDRYVAKPDASYSWNVVKTVHEPGLTTFLVDLKIPDVAQPGRSRSHPLATLVDHRQT